MTSPRFLKVLTKIPNYLFIGIITSYQKFLSPVFPNTCRFYPTCSVYSKQAFQKYNIFKAFYLSAWRILRCNPWSKGGIDPLP
ncbi:MAG TPA: membrane protein insertion efficiency factor YidD [Candidatus Cloacimonetes bacterium]|nr:membrane protein insertion efficiency factor YidD [Candidatus Cloacimonadota bacterium]